MKIFKYKILSLVCLNVLNKKSDSMMNRLLNTFNNNENKFNNPENSKILIDNEKINDKPKIFLLVNFINKNDKDGQGRLLHFVEEKVIKYINENKKLVTIFIDSNKKNAQEFKKKLKDLGGQNYTLHKNINNLELFVSETSFFGKITTSQIIPEKSQEEEKNILLNKTLFNMEEQVYTKLQENLIQPLKEKFDHTCKTDFVNQLMIEEFKKILEETIKLDKDSGHLNIKIYALINSKTEKELNEKQQQDKLEEQKTKLLLPIYLVENLNKKNNNKEYTILLNEPKNTFNKKINMTFEITVAPKNLNKCI
jgi:hypothetical protein